MKESKLFTWSKSDLAKTLVMLVISTFLSLIGDAILQAINAGDYSFSNIHWNEIFAAILLVVVTYLKKNFLTNSSDEFLKKEKN